ncbi:hypothetical protein M3M39_05800 [Fructilactobacillus hinvesii]|uniref:Uncharacterized protein n=1 Tax=Fructilactobacillus hinvesii TaxID=2940300 RepID=A0ABY5BV62_9LACO|nr:hypothetical protein [Fructilactobacillus hinvesii]USS87634.1 hypothetical protein M3M39_05800 [Fructilactobacillus hinvesii]
MSKSENDKKKNNSNGNYEIAHKSLFIASKSQFDQDGSEELAKELDKVLASLDDMHTSHNDSDKKRKNDNPSEN